MVRVLISLLAILGSAIAISEVNQKCMNENNEAFSNDNLIGTWYSMYNLNIMVSAVPQEACTEREITRPSAEIIQQYKDKYNDPNAPYNIDDNPVQITEVTSGLPGGMIVGNNIAKFFVLTPNTTQGLNSDGYTVNAYRLLSPKYLMYTECALRGHIRRLWSTDRYAPVEEMEQLINDTPELRHMMRQRFCATY